MKKLFPLFSAMLFFTAAFGQIEWVADNPEKEDILYKLFKMKNEQNILLRKIQPKNLLTVIDSTGAEIFNFNGDSTNYVDPYKIDNLYDVFERPNSQIIGIVADAGYYDTLSNNGYTQNAIVEINSEGKVVKAFLTEWGVSNLRFGASLSDGSYVLLSQQPTLLYKYSADGSDIFWQYYFDENNGNGLVVLPGDSIVVATDMGLFLFDEDGEILAEFPDYIFTGIKASENGGIVGINGDSIFLLSPNFTLEASDGFPGDMIEDFAVGHGKIAALTSSNQVYQFDAGLSFLNNFLLTGDEQFKFITIGQQRLVLGGGERYSYGNIYYDTLHSSFIKEFSFEGDDYGLSNDIGVTAFHAGEEADIVPYSSGFYVKLKDAKATVKNFGNNVVDSFYLHCRGNEAKYHNLALQPGEEVELEWEGDLDVYSPTYPSGQTLNLCAWTSHPDLRLDTDASNDKACVDFLVSSGEAAQPGGGFSIFPNPSSSQSTLQYWLPSAAQGEARIFDSLGRQVAVYGLAGGDGVVVLPQLPKGVYFVALYSEGSVVDKEKFISM
jgi:hypothetical protein